MAKDFKEMEFHQKVAHMTELIAEHHRAKEEAERRLVEAEKAKEAHKQEISRLHSEMNERVRHAEQAKANAQRAPKEADRPGHAPAPHAAPAENPSELRREFAEKERALERQVLEADRTIATLRDAVKKYERNEAEERRELRNLEQQLHQINKGSSTW